jgi:hypothetical protein
MRAERDDTPGPTRSTGRPITRPGGNPVYVAAGIRRELDHLAAAVKGNRNDTLNVAAFAVFGFVKGGPHGTNTRCSGRGRAPHIARSRGLTGAGSMQQLGELAIGTTASPERSSGLDRQDRRLPCFQDVLGGVTPPVECVLSELRIGAAARPVLAATTIEWHHPP